MILHYSLAILNTNDNALSLLFFANAPMSGPYQSHNFDHTYLYPETSLSKGCRTEVKITVDFESPLTKSLLSFGAKKSLNLYKEKTSQKALVPTYNISLFAMYMIYY